MKEAEAKKYNFKPVVLIILDGFGISPDKYGSPWEVTDHPTFTEIEKFYPFTTLQASGIAVGLPWGKEGNSEVGHLAIGAGKTILNFLPKISSAIEDGSFFKNEAFLGAVNYVKTNGSNLNIMGVFSSGTVHAYSEHLYALLDLAQKEGAPNVNLHLFTDGKDAFHKEGAEYFKKLEADLLAKYPNVKIATVIGRRFAMDRSENWPWIKQSYETLTIGGVEKYKSASEFIAQNYAKDIFDEEMTPGILDTGDTNSRIKDNDAVIFYNFREDSAREITHAFVEENFNKFERKKLQNLFFVTMTEYEKGLPVHVAFPSAEVEWPLARVIAEAGKKQMHIAETQKYAHITYFLNGGKEEEFPGEDRVLIPSPKISSYDLEPEMSARQITEKVLESMGKYDFIAVNFANADMVGHTGNFAATAKAFAVIDECVGRILPRVLDLGGVVVITADHGNAEEKLYKTTGQEKTQHSINPVPCHLIANEFKYKESQSDEVIKKKYKEVSGIITDVAPTLLELMNLQKPTQMTGRSLLKELLK